jgi:hypothetical protein
LIQPSGFEPESRPSDSCTPVQLNRKPLRSERRALPDCASGQWQGVQELNLGGWVQKPAPNPFGQLPAKIEATVRGQYYSALMLPFPCRTVGKIGPVDGSRTHVWRATISRPGPLETRRPLMRLPTGPLVWPAINLVRPHRLERWFLANRASVLAAVRRAHGAEAGNRTQVGRLPSDCSATELQRLEPSVRIELTSPVYRTGASPAMLTRLKRWCGVRDSNPCRSHGKATS